MSDATKAAPERKLRCLVIQLARLGDTVQSLMALRAAQQLYPSLEITFVCREGFSAAAKRVPWIAEVVTLPTDRILRPILDGSSGEGEGIRELARWLSPLAAKPWDFVVNWTYSESSSFLAGLLPARVKLGYSRRKDLSLAALDGWSHYLQAVVQGRIPQNIHLTDILTTQILTALQIHVGDPESDGNSAVTSKSFFSLRDAENPLRWSWRENSRRWVAFQLGAGREDKVWQPERWAKLASLIITRHPDCGIALLGGKEDLPRAEAFEAALNKLIGPYPKPVIQLVGKGDFDAWAQAISHSQWLVSGDTAAVHLASVLGTRTLNLSVGEVRWQETGPYGNGHYVVAATPEADNGISPEAAYAAWSYAAGEWSHRRLLPLESHFAKLGYEAEMPKVDIRRSRIRGTEDGGGVVYESLSKRPLGLEEWLGQAAGHIARAWYCGWTPAVGSELDRAAIRPELIRSLREIQESTEVLSKVCGEAKRAAHALHEKGAALKSDKLMPISDRKQIEELGEKLRELDALIERLGKASPSLLLFAQMSRVLMHNLTGDQLSEVGLESAESYAQLESGVAILREWLAHTLGLARPVAVRDAKVVPIQEITP